MIMSDISPGPYFGLGISALAMAIFSFYLPECLNFQLPTTIEDTLYMQKSKEMVHLISIIQKTLKVKLIFNFYIYNTWN